MGNNIINREIAHLDLRDEKLVERAVIDHVQTLLDAIRSLPAREAIKFVLDVTKMIRKIGGTDARRPGR